MTAPAVEVTEDHEAVVGALTVRRALPRRTRRTVGGWCFADHMGPAELAADTNLIGPHPHIGLQTVTWLIDGQALHRDSLGTEQVISAGQLNLMTAGNGVAHSEEATGRFSGMLEGIQLWIAQPEQTRHGAAAFEHHAFLPHLELDHAIATVLVGSLGEVASPARHDTALVGAELDLRTGTTTLPLRKDFEYAVIVLRGRVAVDRAEIAVGTLGYLGAGRDELAIDASESSRAMLLGGEPFGEEISMWWNFVGRSHDEISAAYRSWQEHDERFADVDTSLDRIAAPVPPWLSSTQG